MNMCFKILRDAFLGIPEKYLSQLECHEQVMWMCCLTESVSEEKIFSLLMLQGHGLSHTPEHWALPGIFLHLNMPIPRI